ncbi:hypothetical protein M91_21655 [Bos mutus]|uniref:CSN8/PSMD8/EIF3K domain-containing protein n=1 Tax=Bos mutus TaxID=72004 RepID=L8IY16_9CETA|nr:hypothetical protein M91_21655 [Bos mutus]
MNERSDTAISLYGHRQFRLGKQVFNIILTQSLSLMGIYFEELNAYGNNDNKAKQATGFCKEYLFLMFKVPTHSSLLSGPLCLCLENSDHVSLKKVLKAQWGESQHSLAGFPISRAILRQQGVFQYPLMNFLRERESYLSALRAAGLVWDLTMTQLSCHYIHEAGRSDSPVTDGGNCKQCMIDQAHQEERPIRQILYLGDLLETCHFQAFWQALDENMDLLEGITGFEDSVRKFICHVVGITYQHIDRWLLAEMLGNLTDSQLKVWMSKYGWSADESGQIFIW